MQSLDVFMSRLLPQVPGCPQPTAQQALLDAAIEFCTETVVLQVITDPQRLQPGVGSYDADLPPNTELVRVMHAWCGTRKLDLAQPMRVGTRFAYEVTVGADSAPLGSPTALTVTPSGALSLLPVPDVPTATAETLTMRVAVRPKITATQVPDELYFVWSDAVVYGALFRLAAMPGQAFSDAAVSEAAFSRFRYYVNRAKTEANRDRVGGGARAYNTPFA